MKKILLAIDHSPYAIDAARFLARLPHADPLEVTVLTVLQSGFINHSDATAPWMREADRVAAMEAFEEVEQMFDGANVRLRHELHEGHAAQTIVEAATELQADLVVIGARGHSNISRMLLGSTSDYVATHAPCSVLVIRPSTRERGTGPLQITLGYEKTGPAQAALEELAEIGWGEGAEIHVVSVSPYMSGFFGEIEIDPESITQATDALQRASDQLCNRQLESQTHLLDYEHIGEGLTKYVSDSAADLIVIGETSRSRLGRVLLGSTSRYVLRHAPCSVWITRNRMIQGIGKSHKAAQHVS